MFKLEYIWKKSQNIFSKQCHGKKVKIFYFEKWKINEIENVFEKKPHKIFSKKFILQKKSEYLTSKIYLKRKSLNIFSKDYFEKKVKICPFDITDSAYTSFAWWEILPSNWSDMVNVSAAVCPPQMGSHGRPPPPEEPVCRWSPVPLHPQPFVAPVDKALPLSTQSCAGNEETQDEPTSAPSGQDELESSRRAFVVLQ